MMGGGAVTEGGADPDPAAMQPETQMQQKKYDGMVEPVGGAADDDPTAPGIVTMIGTDMPAAAGSEQLQQQHSEPTLHAQDEGTATAMITEEVRTEAATGVVSTTEDVPMVEADAQLAPPRTTPAPTTPTPDLQANTADEGGAAAAIAAPTATAIEPSPEQISAAKEQPAPKILQDLKMCDMEPENK